MARALVLGGGGIKGAYQAGAIQSVFEAGFHPETILGISAGALSASYIVNYLGSVTDKPPTPDQWKDAAQGFVNFFRQRITGPNVLIKEKKDLKVAWDVLRSSFDGLVDTSPLRDLINETLKPEQL